ncbi:hypothetical protein DFS34DRAFT_119996 [Phlyctochytrium arcticum]|nr:hypothetical protein DFS34DRAFT_119996 [Phlyctochytrium arcticum]
MDPIAMELQANDKAHRKIMDLEISNTSLLAVNSSLENTMRQQAQELEDLREELERLRQNSALSPESVTRHQRQAPPEYPPLAWSSTHEEEGDDDADEIAFARVCAKVQQMIEDGLKSTQYRVPSSILDDDEPESRRGVDDSGSLGRTPGALRKRSSSMSIDSDYKPMAIKVHHNHKPPLAPGHATTKGRSPSFTRSVSSRSSCDSVASYNSTRSSNSHGYLGDKESSSAVKARRLSIVMRPVIDAPTHTYLDDPYESLDSSTSSNNQMLSYSMQSSASSSAPY